jgi:hypothetical protein
MPATGARIQGKKKGQIIESKIKKRGKANIQ